MYVTPSIFKKISDGSTSQIHTDPVPMVQQDKIPAKKFKMDSSAPQRGITMSIENYVYSKRNPLQYKPNPCTMQKRSNSQPPMRNSNPKKCENKSQRLKGSAQSKLVIDDAESGVSEDERNSTFPKPVSPDGSFESQGDVLDQKDVTPDFTEPSTKRGRLDTFKRNNTRPACKNNFGKLELGLEKKSVFHQEKHNTTTVNGPVSSLEALSMKGKRREGLKYSSNSLNFERATLSWKAKLSDGRNGEVKQRNPRSLSATTDHRSREAPIMIEPKAIKSNSLQHLDICRASEASAITKKTRKLRPPSENRSRSLENENMVDKPFWEKGAKSPTKTAKSSNVNTGNRTSVKHKMNTTPTSKKTENKRKTENTLIKGKQNKLSKRGNIAKPVKRHRSTASSKPSTGESSPSPKRKVSFSGDSKKSCDEESPGEVETAPQTNAVFKIVDFKGRDSWENQSNKDDPDTDELKKELKQSLRGSLNSKDKYTSCPNECNRDLVGQKKNSNKTVLDKKSGYRNLLRCPLPHYGYHRQSQSLTQWKDSLTKGDSRNAPKSTQKQNPRNEEYPSCCSESGKSEMRYSDRSRPSSKSEPSSSSVSSSPSPQRRMQFPNVKDKAHQPMNSKTASRLFRNASDAVRINGRYGRKHSNQDVVDDKHTLGDSSHERDPKKICNDYEGNEDCTNNDYENKSKKTGYCYDSKSKGKDVRRRDFPKGKRENKGESDVLKNKRKHFGERRDRKDDGKDGEEKENLKLKTKDVGQIDDHKQIRKNIERGGPKEKRKNVYQRDELNDEIKDIGEEDFHGDKRKHLEDNINISKDLRNYAGERTFHKEKRINVRDRLHLKHKGKGERGICKGKRRHEEKDKLRDNRERDYLKNKEDIVERSDTINRKYSGPKRDMLDMRDIDNKRILVKINKHLNLSKFYNEQYTDDDYYNVESDYNFGDDNVKSNCEVSSSLGNEFEMSHYGDAYFNCGGIFKPQSRRRQKLGFNVESLPRPNIISKANADGHKSEVSNTSRLRLSKQALKTRKNSVNNQEHRFDRGVMTNGLNKNKKEMSVWYESSPLILYHKRDINRSHFRDLDISLTNLYEKTYDIAITVLEVRQIVRNIELTRSVSIVQEPIKKKPPELDTTKYNEHNTSNWRPPKWLEGYLLLLLFMTIEFVVHLYLLKQ